ncbi:type II secretion system protein [Sporosarcina sp. A2]|uniref:type II secretion system protein n=1 Tax=Sporosarcina sp. A2 TaxID=3393449 RepID=UPI003D7B4F72
MENKRRNNNESGLTLIEILASLVILGIVFVAFMTIFPQMTLFNNRTETKLETMNEARIVLEEYRSKSISFTPIGTCPNDNWSNLQYTGSPGEHKVNKNRSVFIEIKNCPDVEPAKKNVAGVVQLHQIHIEIREKDKLSSESFGYVKVE